MRSSGVGTAQEAHSLTERVDGRYALTRTAAAMPVPASVNSQLR